VSSCVLPQLPPDSTVADNAGVHELLEETLGRVSGEGCEGVVFVGKPFDDKHGGGVMLIGTQNYGHCYCYSTPVFD
jgi:hypothetical protein